MEALVTGASGFVGSHLVEHLLGKGYTVRCLVRRSSNLAWIDSLPVRIIRGDLDEPQSLAAAVSGADYVYHCAGRTRARVEAEYSHANAAGTRNLLQAALRHAPGLRRFVYVSSQTAAGPSPGPRPIAEDHPPAPITAYGRSKLAAEQECRAAAGRIPVTICRPCAVFGPRDRDILAFFRTMNARVQPVIGFREKRLCLVHAADLARALVLAGESARSAGETYFVANPDVYGWREMGEATRRALGKRALRVRVPELLLHGVAAVAEGVSRFGATPALLNREKARDMVQGFWTCDVTKAQRHFGFTAALSLEEGVRDTVRWYRAQGWLT